MLGALRRYKHAPEYILAVNAGSSSIKAVVYETGGQLEVVCQCTIENIGQSSAILITQTTTNRDAAYLPVDVKTHPAAIVIIMGWINKQVETTNLLAIGHRIVHGGPQYYQPQVINDQLIADLQAFSSYDPDHLPNSIQLIKKFTSLYPNLPQVACFDTAFTHNLPRVAQILPIPRKYEQEGLRRYGFHGLSYSYLLSRLQELDAVAANGRVIFAHLGSGASLVAIRDGQPLDVTMGLTPASGIPMSTRSGDLDPGIAWYLHHKAGVSTIQFNNMVNHQSGLLGISETSADMKTLLLNEHNDVRAAEAVSLFCYQAKKAIGSMAAVMGGVETLVFSGGIGEKAPLIRARICEGLEFLGLELDEAGNNSNTPEISSHASRVSVRVIHTDEESVIAQQVSDVINNSSINKRGS
ncbi:MAG: acetate/propionate family kinase [Candidatus Saccharibacteria bacterium]